MRLFARAAIVWVLLLVPAAEVHAEWVLGAEGAVVYESNLSRATREVDRESDVAFVPSFSFGYYWQLTDATGLLATFDFRASIYSEFAGLTNFSPTLNLGVRHKFGLGGLAPWLRVFASGGAIDYDDDVRDTAIVDVGAEVGKRFSERVDLRFGYTYERLDANDRVFDGDSHTLSLRSTVGLTSDLYLTLGYSVRWGDLVVHRTPGPGDWSLRNARIVNTFDRPMTATRIDATTHFVSIALGWALTQHTSLNAGYEYQISIGPQFDYPNHVVRASFNYNF